MRGFAGIPVQRLYVNYPRRYLHATPAWLEGWRPDFRDDIEAEYLLDQQQAADAARREP
jgi:hypothetical protein